MDERRVEANGPKGTVPGLLYVPDDPSPGVMLLGHGGAGGKDAPLFVELARGYARGTGLPVLCIDGPAHGERAPDTGSQEENFRLVRRAVGSRESTEQMIADWTASATQVAELGAPVAYAGFSMGTLFGVPVVAAMRTMRAAVFAIGGVAPPGALSAFIGNLVGGRAGEIAAEEAHADVRGDTVLEAAARIDHCEVLQLNMTRDEIFPPDGALRMFDAFPAGKRLMFWEGGHVGLPAEAIAQSVAFVRRIVRGE